MMDLLMAFTIFVLVASQTKHKASQINGDEKKEYRFAAISIAFYVLAVFTAIAILIKLIF